MQGQDFVFANGKLVAVQNDPETHGAGNLIPSHHGIFINGIPIIVHNPDLASVDDAGHIPTQTETAAGSPNVLAYI